MKRYVISDMHFGHENVIKYCERPFSSVEEMDSAIIKNWNEVVEDEDIVFVLGDMSIHGDERTTEIIQQLKGRKFLILGNHDRRRNINFWKGLFEDVYRYPICVDQFLLSHEPIEAPEPYYNIHGHIHDKPDISPRHINVSVERTLYQPFNLDTAKSILKKQNRR